MHKGLIIKSLLLFLISILIPYHQASCDEYYVALNGSDSNPGTLAEPFRTIKQAADLMVAGDICYIRRGIYYESLIPTASGTANMPIRFEAYNNEKVLITTSDTVSNWSLHQGNIYKTYVNWSLGPGNNQVFVNGEMMIEARYPNLDEEYDYQMNWFGSGEKDGQVLNRAWPPEFPRTLLHPTYFRFASGYDDKGYYKVSDGTLPIKLFNPFITNRGDDFWTGALLWNPGNFWGSGGVIRRSQDVGDTTIVFLETDRFRWPSASVISGIMPLLDTEGEWVLQNDTLYFWPPWDMTPDEMRVSVKRRKVVANLIYKDFIELVGLNFHGGSAVLDESHYCVIDNCHFQYVSHFTSFTHRYDGLASGSNSNKRGGNRGIYISGSNNVFKNSSVAYSAASGVILADTNNTVTNCLIHDIDYNSTYAAGVFFGQPLSRQYSNGHVVSHNTIYNCGRSCINFHRVNPYDADIKLLYNNLYASMCISQDGGTIYADSTPSNNIEIGYNWFHEVYNGPGCYVYFDHLGGRECSIHHNVFFRNPVAARKFLTYSARNAWMYNNTFVARHKEVSALTTLLRIYKEEYPDMVANNLDATLDQAQWMFTDTLNMDYSLQAGSPAIDSGIDVPGITDGAMGRPDLGAYEYGGEKWIPGHDWGEPPDMVELWGEGKTVRINQNFMGNSNLKTTVSLSGNKLNITSPANSAFYVKIINAQGKVIIQKTFQKSSKTVLPIGSMATGIYAIVIREKNGEIIRKVFLNPAN